MGIQGINAASRAQPITEHYIQISEYSKMISKHYPMDINSILILPEFVSTEVCGILSAILN